MEKDFLGDYVDQMLSHVRPLTEEGEQEDGDLMTENFPEGLDQWNYDAECEFSLAVRAYRAYVNDAQIMFSNYFSQVDLDVIMEWCDYLGIKLEPKDDKVKLLKKIANYFSFKPAKLSTNEEELKDMLCLVDEFYDTLFTFLQDED